MVFTAGVSPEKPGVSQETEKAERGLVLSPLTSSTSFPVNRQRNGDPLSPLAGSSSHSSQPMLLPHPTQVGKEAIGPLPILPSVNVPIAAHHHSERKPGASDGAHISL